MFRDLLKQKLAGIVRLEPHQIEALENHYQLLVRWNRALNLTSIESEDLMVERHYCESVFAAKYLPDAAESVADVGSGAGFPGVPIAIMRSGCAVSLIESHQKKAAFLREASRGLPNVRVVARRAEDVEQRFEWVVSRAVRYSDIGETLKKLGNKAELLTGEVGPEGLPGFDWKEPIRLPWGERRYLWLGNRST